MMKSISPELDTGGQGRLDVDFAPGQSHIALRYPHKCFYVPEVFHMSMTYTISVPLFISDINESVDLENIYGPRATYLRGVLIINNHPVRRVRIVGRIVGEVYKDYGMAHKSNYVLITVDDSSSTSSQIPVKVPESKYISKGLKYGHNYGRLVEACGICLVAYGGREIKCDYLNILGGDNDFHLEIANWKTTLDYRQSVLSIPWEYEPSTKSIVGDNFTDEPRYEPDELVRRLERSALQLQGTMSQMPDLVREDSRLTNLKRMQQEVIEIDEEEEGEEEEETSGDHASFNSCTSHEYTEPDFIYISSQDKEAEEELEIVDVRQVSLPVITEFQLTIEFLKYIINHNFKPFRLVDLYKDDTYFDSLTNYVHLQLALTHIDDKSPHKSRTFQQEILFHRIRHNLQVNYNLITVTKSQRVKARNFHRLYYDLSVILSRLQFQDPACNFNVVHYLESIRTTFAIGDSFPYKAINSVVDYILTDVLHTRKNWKYDPKAQEWSCVAAGAHNRDYQ
ncbi:telomere regulation protein Stn1-domain-containing protein [Scheffersomyces amazonensis]|uniref:telomere regulation protein Stn1-domain-containing protein n=1 Tax=Scheffersomyces amazonensis TaxID=1078765 RepID=UPI00315D71A0